MSKILIIHNDPSLLQVMKLILKKGNYEVIDISPQEDIAAAVESYKPDLVFIDTNLPEKNAMELCTGIRKNKPSGNIPVILITSPALKPEELEGCAPEFILQKPFHLEQLMEIIHRHLKK